jgi:hypothetical protein
LFLSSVVEEAPIAGPVAAGWSEVEGLVGAGVGFSLGEAGEVEGGEAVVADGVGEGVEEIEAGAESDRDEEAAGLSNIGT